MTLPKSATMPLTIDAAFARIHDLERAIGKVIVGQHQLVRRLLTGLFAAIPYAFADDEVRMLHHVDRRLDVEPLRTSDVTHIRRLITDTVYVDDKIREYIVRLGRATRAPGEVGQAELTEFIVLGISPRSYQHVLALARV